MTGATPLVELRFVSRTFAGPRRGLLGRVGRVSAVEDVSLAIAPGETVGLVGESGCGKSTLGRIALGMTRVDSGRVVFDGRDVTHTTGDAWRALRRQMQLVFQDSLGSLDPRLPVMLQVREVLDIHGVGTLAERAGTVIDMLARVGLTPALAERYPHQLSGGQQQRVAIARALIAGPRFLVCDEPVSALDVSVQAQIVNLLMDLQRSLRLGYLFISHDLAVVRHVATWIAVMYSGRVVELAPSRTLIEAPAHPYTRALIASVPKARRRADDGGARSTAIIGEPPSPLRPPPGCRFHPRCPRASTRCREEVPALTPIRASHLVACHHAGALA
ncbi:MAG: ABC transporter ATP-binding protein [Ectothiorhodospiraceae bacterium]|nr:ABC transporter ATP-binding protein [Ectothiorhodospiraceae bacterium]